MSDVDTGDLKALQDRVDAEKRAVDALQAEYNKALDELRTLLQHEAMIQALWAQMEGQAHLLE
jgi:hypothetical protein